jgi:ribose 5-phosphate isomerase B
VSPDVAAGWYPDPQTEGQLRYWDGSAWTEHVQAAGSEASGAQGAAAGVAEEAVDYPPLCEDVCRRVLEGHADFAIVIGGSGSGETIACNKIRGIRATLCLDPWVAEIARANNDANVLVTGAKVVAPDYAELIVERWLATSFRGGRHAERLAQIAALERGESVL